MKGVDDLFLEHGDRLIIEDPTRMKSFLDYVLSANSPWLPPGRNNGRTTAHRERYCLRYYLRAHADTFDYPIAVEKTERPDFLITDAAGKCFGVEHTDAGPEHLQRWLAQSENGDGVSQPLHRDGEGAADGFSADATCHAAVDDIVAALRHKVGSINKNGYQDADRYELIIYLVSNALRSIDGDSARIFSQLPDFQSVQANESAVDAAVGAAVKTFDCALVIVNDEARYWR